MEVHTATVQTEGVSSPETHVVHGELRGRCVIHQSSFRLLEGQVDMDKVFFYK